jgi:hypothetical protein
MSLRTSLLAAVGLLALGLAAPPAGAAGSLTITYTTQPHGGPYAPRNIVAVWVEDAAGNFVRTIDRYAATRKSHLIGWIAKAGNADTDAVSGATRANHTGALTRTWDLTGRGGTEIPDGTYTIRMELADSNASTAAQNAQGTFTFVKGTAPQSQTGLANGGFTGVSIAFTPGAPSPTCGNGAVDTGETCDGASCPTSCAASGDACAVNTLSGSAAACTAACAPVAITACVDDDGCCPAGCAAIDDTDCGADGGGGPTELTGGCAANRPLPPAALGLVLAWLATRRRRPR